jgi:NADP-dependent 3-hydroxy acid dehydrogenase YdfG
MSSKVTISEVKASNSRMTAETAPRTVVFIGSTAGIGKATLARLVAQQTVIKVYVVGRNAAKHRAFIDQLQESNNKATVIFLEGQVSLMAEVKRICNEIKAKESSIDAIFLSSGYIPYGGRESSFTSVLYS